MDPSWQLSDSSLREEIERLGEILDARGRDAAAADEIERALAS